VCMDGLRVFFFADGTTSIPTPNLGRRALDPRLHTPHVCLNVHATTPRFAGVSPCVGQRDSRDSPWRLEEGNQLCMGGSDTDQKIFFSFTFFILYTMTLKRNTSS
jgi:hypothetical protein